MNILGQYFYHLIAKIGQKLEFDWLSSIYWRSIGQKKKTLPIF